jgi:hypothetical protein
LFTIFLARCGIFNVSGKKIMGLGNQREKRAVFGKQRILAKIINDKIYFFLLFYSLFISEIYKERWEREYRGRRKQRKV